jgi:hypothetical protein
MTSKEANEKEKNFDNLLKGLFFAFTAGVGLLSGFGLSVARTKKTQTEELFQESLKKTRDFESRKQQQLIDAELHEAGTTLARRALFRATVYSVTGVSLFCFCIWKLSGANNFEEFRNNIGTFLPKIKRKQAENSGRTEFKNLTDLFQYIIDEDNLKKKSSKNDKIE